jgi:amylovoran biosynthesis glycosyltransferase AmsE
MKFSALMPLHNGVNFNLFKKSINSVITNSLLPNEFLILVDGNLSNNKKEFLLKKKKKSRFIKIFFLERRGLVSILNYGLKIAKYNVIARVDSDDINDKHRFFKQITFFKKKKLDILGSNIKEIFHGHSYCKKIIYQPRLFDFMISNPINHPTVIFNKKKIMNIGSYPNINFKEDFVLWFLAKLSGFKINNLKECLVTSHYNFNTMKRRKSVDAIISEFKILLFLGRKNILYLLIFVLVLPIRLTYLLMPNVLYIFIYKNFLRKKI